MNLFQKGSLNPQPLAILDEHAKQARFHDFDTAKTLGFCVQTTGVVSKPVVCKPFGAPLGASKRVSVAPRAHSLC